MNSWQDRLYFGTWQLGGSFKPFTDGEVSDLLHCAWEQGICRYDTAAVYGRGYVEEMLAAHLPASALIVTKLPAVHKPDPVATEPSEVYYPHSWLQQSLDGCRRRLQRDCLDAVLLHNWLAAWDTDLEQGPLGWLLHQKQLGNVHRLGLSLPDGFSSGLSAGALSMIDVVEAPYNRANQWICAEHNRYTNADCEVLLRSLFERGHRAREESASSVLPATWSLDTALVIGMTTSEQIRQNCAILADLGGDNEP